MPLRPTSVDLTVERELLGDDGVPRRYRLSARFASEPAGEEASVEELRSRFQSLSRQLDLAVGGGAAPSPEPRATRPLAELVETYRPRQRELVDLLLAEGELSRDEAEQLHRYLEERARGVAGEVPLVERPIAAAPIAADRSPTVPRPVPELLASYKIESLRQAGAVRARRQISYEEYMALKRHFGALEAAASAAPPAATADDPTRS